MSNNHNNVAAQGSRVVCEIRLPSDQHKLYCWKVRGDSYVSSGEIVALARLKKEGGMGKLAGNNNEAKPAAAAAAASRHKRPTRRRRPGPAAAAVVAAAPTGNEKETSPKASGEKKEAPATSPPVAEKSNNKNKNFVPIVAQGDGVVHLGPRPRNRGTAVATLDDDDDALVIGYIDQCRHPTIMEGLCAVCGREAKEPRSEEEALDSSSSVVSSSGSTTTSSSSLKPPPPKMRHVTVGGLTVAVSEEEGRRMAQQDAERLRQQRKLSLVLDLDHTLVHATNDVRARQHLGRSDVRSLVLPMLVEQQQQRQRQQQQPPAARSAVTAAAAAPPQQQHMWMQHFVKLRPYVKEFLLTALELFEIGVYTAGTRDYAEQITIMLARYLVGATCDQVDLDALRHQVFMAETELQRANAKVTAEMNSVDDDKKPKAETSEQDKDEPKTETSDQDKNDTKADSNEADGGSTKAEAGEPDKDAKKAELSESGENGAETTTTASQPQTQGAIDKDSSDGTTNGDLEETKSLPSSSSSSSKKRKRVTFGEEKDPVDGEEEKAEAKKSPSKKKSTTKRVTFGETTKEQKSDQVTTEQVTQLQIKLRQAEELESRAQEMRQRLFGSRVVSRTDVGDLGRDVKSLKRIFPCGGTMAVVVDDREDVWANAGDNDDNVTTTRTTSRKGEPPENLLLVRPYHWYPFMGFADVNNAAGADLSKTGNTTTNSKPEGSSDPGTKETDEQLLWTRDILQRLHQRYYAQEQQQRQPNTVAEILSQMRRQVLSGGSVILSGLVPLHKQQQQQRRSNNGVLPPRPPVVRYVESLGATVLPTVTADVTHVVAALDGTDKILSARRAVPSCFIVRALWLMECVWSLTRREEQPHLLGAGPSPKAKTKKQTTSKLSPGGSSSNNSSNHPTTTAAKPPPNNNSNNNKPNEGEDDDDDDDYDDEELAAEFEKDFL